MDKQRKLTQAELMTEAVDRFGPDPLDIAFRCPACGDVATIREFPETDRPRAGQECIGRSLGALNGELTDRGCDWAAYGLIRGPWTIALPNGELVYGFPLADAPVVADA